MTPEVAIDILKQLVERIFLVASPLLLTAMVVGLIVSLVQTITSVQEQTLTFVPKALAVLGVLILILPWILRTVLDYTSGVINLMPQMVR
jgi:flagellar biosynthesis protein FliQ